MAGEGRPKLALKECHICGSDIDEDAEYCPECGADFASETSYNY
ncbi:zinc-ribbon domain-containing protein [Candidatus Woesearchaeota archaeon]|nr:zinc-ribbon domain-containing protein [Candidatus Woesearchaeota archaeon]